MRRKSKLFPPALPLDDKSGASQSVDSTSVITTSMNTSAAGYNKYNILNNKDPPPKSATRQIPRTPVLGIRPPLSAAKQQGQEIVMNYPPLPEKEEQPDSIDLLLETKPRAAVNNTKHLSESSSISNHGNSKNISLSKSNVILSNEKDVLDTHILSTVQPLSFQQEHHLTDKKKWKEASDRDVILDHENEEKLGNTHPNAEENSAAGETGEERRRRRRRGSGVRQKQTYISTAAPAENDDHEEEIEKLIHYEAKKNESSSNHSIIMPSSFPSKFKNELENAYFPEQLEAAFFSDANHQQQESYHHWSTGSLHENGKLLLLKERMLFRKQQRKSMMIK